MKLEEEAYSVFRTVPNVFYDLIVYYGSSIVFFIGLIFLSFDFGAIRSFLSTLDVLGKIILLLVALSACYIYGQLSSMLSYYLIKKPVNRIIKLLNPKQRRDYFFEYSQLLDDFPVFSTLSSKKDKNYWSLIYYIKILRPDIGDDLLKRYARVKISRINALNTFMLLVYLGLMSLFRNLQTHIQNPVIIALILLFFVILFLLEFYQRQCWFGDITVKIYASIQKASRKSE